MKYLLLTILCLGMFSTGVYAMIETLGLEELARQSELIITAKVVAIDTVAKNAENAKLFADLPEGLTILHNQIEVIECHKGSLAAGEKLTIQTWGGFEDTASFVKDASYMLFLAKHEGNYIVVNAPQGCWPVEADGKFSGMGFETTLEQVKAAIK